MAAGDPARHRVVDRSIVAGFAAVMAVFALSLWLGTTLNPIRKVEWGVSDFRARRFAAGFRAERSPVVIVDIDDESSRELQTVWPWHRGLYAKLLENLFAAGASTVVLDVIFDAPRTDNLAGDSAFAATLERYAGRVVLGGKTWFSDVSQRDFTVTFERGGAQVMRPQERFMASGATRWGLTDVKVDADGVVREYYTGRAIADGDTVFPTLAVRAWELVTQSRFTFRSSALRIAYPGPARSYFPYYSFYRVLDDDHLVTSEELEWEETYNFYDSLVAEKRFTDRVVFVGSSMAEAHDMKLTPFSRTLTGGQAQESPGVEVHAAAFHTLLNGYRIAEAPTWMIYAALCVVCIVLYAAGITAPGWIYALCALAAVAGWTAVSFAVYARWTVMVPVATPMFALLMVTAGQQVFLFYREQQRRREVTSMFGRYVPSAVVQELIRDPAKMRLGGEKRELTVLFCDVEGFTSLTETLGPERIVELLNEYLTAMTEIVLAEGGIIDKYEGDLIMAEFGIPIALEDHALRACRTAFRMQKRLHELHDKWRIESKPLLRARTGIGSGPMVFGNMGSTQVFDYTVMGDVVNLASRLEGVNKTYGTRVMINERTARLVRGQMLVREIDLLLVHGKHKPETCYQLMAPVDSPKAEEIRRVTVLFEGGLRQYRQQRWDGAIKSMQAVLEMWPDDEPAKVFLARCEAFRRKGPGAGWDGVFAMASK